MENSALKKGVLTNSIVLLRLANAPYAKLIYRRSNPGFRVTVKLATLGMVWNRYGFGKKSEDKLEYIQSRSLSACNNVFQTWYLYPLHNYSPLNTKRQIKRMSDSVRKERGNSLQWQTEKGTPATVSERKGEPRDSIRKKRDNPRDSFRKKRGKPAILSERKRRTQCPI